MEGRAGLRVIFVTVVVAAIAFQTITLGMAEMESARDPAAALRWRPGFGPALAGAAAERLAAARSHADVEQAGALARKAWAAGPLQTEAIRVEGLAEAEGGRPALGGALLRIAARRSRRDIPTHLWLFGDVLQRADYRAAALHADLLMRVSDLHDAVFPALQAALGDPRAAEALAARFALHPPWRSWFLADLGAHDADLAAPLRLFRAMRDDGAPPSDAETAPYFARLAAERPVRTAYAAWASLLPPAGVTGLALLYDGGFEGRPGPPPFNWRLVDRPEAFAERRPRPGATGSALHAVYDDAESQPLAEELLVLPAGDYVLSGAFATDSALDPDQVGWSLTCERGGPRLVDVRQGGDAAPTWRPFSIRFTVPSGRCDGQRLQLDGRAGSSIARVSVWYAALRITPAGGADASNPIGRGAARARHRSGS